MEREAGHQLVAELQRRGLHGVGGPRQARAHADPREHGLGHGEQRAVRRAAHLRGVYLQLYLEHVDNHNITFYQ